MTKIQNPKCEYDLKKERFNSMFCKSICFGYWILKFEIYLPC
jgi:hypothetical protein